ncbi:MAG: hypothetical protein OXI81_18335 [Paracoccaceae bacterium]|nr:hypothetical protein [Paracoccaceae bacterium]MDE2913178.1 hypothetical protein [Paracoccaceae bacterium]
MNNQLKFPGVLIQIVVPAPPVHIMFRRLHAALSPAPGHVGFDEVLLDDLSNEVTTKNVYSHHLHHAILECNCAEGAIPLDECLDTFNDGSPDSMAATKTRVWQMHG